MLEIKLSKAAVSKVPDGAGWVKIIDPTFTGLQLYSSTKGTKTFYLYRRVKGTPKRIKLGTHPNLTPELVRKEAAKLAGEIATGHDPNARKRQEKAIAVTLQEAFDAYLDSRKVGKRPLKPRSIDDYRQGMAYTFGTAGWMSKPLTSITRDMVQRLHAKRSKQSKARADHAMRVLRAVFNYAMETLEDADGKPIITDNPVRRLGAVKAWNNVPRRQSIITDNQLPDWFAAVLELRSNEDNRTGETASDLILFTLLTGLRKLEASTLQWSDVDLESRTFTVQDTKNSEPHTLPCSDYVLGMLNRRHGTMGKDRYVFQTRKAPFYMTDWRWWVKKTGSASGVDWRIHDLRRVFITTAEKLDLPMSAVKRLANHKTGADVTEGYIVTDVERLRKPVQAITDYLLSVGKVRQKAKILSLQTVHAE